MWIEEREQVKNIYGAETGRFGRPALSPGADGKIDILGWEACRELFLPSQATLTSYYFCHDIPKGRGKPISEFFNKIEIKLGIKSTRRTRFQATSNRKIIRVTPAKFWNADVVRRSLFTALLRASLAYRTSKENFEEALFSRSYTETTRWAVRRFLSGCTVYTGNVALFNGWVSTFVGANRGSIATMLVKPKVKKKKIKAVAPLGLAAA